jgi:hypothetical protein
MYIILTLIKFLVSIIGITRTILFFAAWLRNKAEFKKSIVTLGVTALLVLLISIVEFLVATKSKV